jgi:hypothetical protein
MLTDTQFNQVGNFDQSTINNLKASLGKTETVSAPGALSLATEITYLEVDGTDAFTLAAATTVGHRKIIECITAANTPLGTVTLADAFGSESLTHVFTAVGQKLVLEWRSTGWKVIGKVRQGDQAVVVGTTVLSGFDLCARYNLSVTGTVTSTTTKKIPDGLVPGEQIDVQVTTAATCPSGSIDITAVTIDNAAATTLNTIDGTTAHHGRLVWDGAAWQIVSLTGIVCS